MVRSTTQKIRDDRTFPIRIFFKVPELGLGTRSDDLRKWLHKSLGPTGYSWQAGGRAPGHDRIAIYLRSIGAVVALMEAFTGLELSDTIEEMAKAEARPIQT